MLVSKHYIVLKRMMVVNVELGGIWVKAVLASFKVIWGEVVIACCKVIMAGSSHCLF
jgi:hypothetical protein